MTIEDIKRRNEEKGGKFFSRANMAWFHSRIETEVCEGPGGVFFVTSEETEHNPRRWTVRQFHPEDGDVTTAGPHMKMSKHMAKKRARALAEGMLSVEEGEFVERGLL